MGQFPDPHAVATAPAAPPVGTHPTEEAALKTAITNYLNKLHPPKAGAGGAGGAFSIFQLIMQLLPVIEQIVQAWQTGPPPPAVK